MWISTSLMGSSPVFPASFPAKINVFRRNRPIRFPISCCFFMKVDYIWCPPPSSPSVTHLRGFDLVLRVPRVGERYKPRESAPCVTPAERSKPRALEQAESWLSEIKTSQIAARLSVGGEIKTSYIHYIYSIYIYCLSWDQNLVNQVSLGENARSKPLKSCQKRQLERSKPREWCSLP